MTTEEKRDLEDAEKDVAQELNRPGIFADIPAPAYHRMTAVSSHMLQGFYKTPAHAREAILHPFESSSAQDFGQALHTRVLEPHLFETAYVVAPKVDRRTKAGKETWAAFEAEAGGRFVIDAGTRDVVEEMARSVERHPAAREILAAPGLNEVTVIWDQRVPHDDGDDSLVRSRARIDLLRTIADDTWIWDLKSTQDASERGFERSIAAFRYHMQLGWYALGLDAHAPAPRRAGFIAVEKERPYAVNVLELDALDLEQGQRDAKDHLRQYVRCMSTGIWPAYGDGMGYVGLPQWAKKEAA